MSNPVDFIDGGDPFDPNYVAEYENRVGEVSEDEDNKLKAMIARRATAYKRVFGNLENEDVQIVMADLSHFCRAYQSTWDEKQKKQDLLEGRREVHIRIMQQSRLSNDALFLLSTNATIRKMET